MMQVIKMKGLDLVVGKVVIGKKNDIKEKFVGIERMGVEIFFFFGFKQNGSELLSSEFFFILLCFLIEYYLIIYYLWI